MANMQLVDPVLWGRSTADQQYLESLIAVGLLAPNTDPSGYIVSLSWLHEWGFGVPAEKFIRALCHYYGMELHNFAPIAISQAAVFVAICESYLGIPVHWDLWRHLFRGELNIEFIS